MNPIRKIISNLNTAFSEINPATLNGAMDVIVVQQADGSLRGSPFHVRFGKNSILLPGKDMRTIVDIEVNGKPVDIHMKLAENGVAYFLEECDENEVEDHEVQGQDQVEPGDGPDFDVPSESPNSIEELDEESKSIVLSPSKTDLSSLDISASALTPKATKYRRVLRLSSEILSTLQLHPHDNDLTFTLTTAYQGTSICRSKLFLWSYASRIIISDIDGTITKSDLLGHILPRLGHDWAQVGVAQLFTDIARNGYQFLYLSARAIGQARRTRGYLESLKQDEVGLPEGPVLLNPTSVLLALHREVIEKKPEEFKIACLKEVQELFPENPFFAGFGNRNTDQITYKAVGIESAHIFTINPQGQLTLEKMRSFKSSYTDLGQFVDQMFPPRANPFCDGFSSFMFWRPAFVELDEAEISAAAGQ